MAETESVLGTSDTYSGFVEKVNLYTYMPGQDRTQGDGSRTGHKGTQGDGSIVLTN